MPDKLRPKASVGDGGRNKADGVLAIQKKLDEQGYPAEEDGRFGPKTKSSILAFRKKYLDEATGLVEPGSETEKQLNK